MNKEGLSSQQDVKSRELEIVYSVVCMICEKRSVFVGP